MNLVSRHSIMKTTICESAAKPPARTNHLTMRSNGFLRKLLVPTDFSVESGKALRYARTLAGRFGAAITLLHVVEPFVCTADFGYGDVCRSIPNHDLLKRAKTHLDAISRAQEVSGSRFTTIVRSGTADEEIVKTAQELGTDLIVMGTHGHSGLKKDVLGSIAEKVVHCAPCAVFVVRNGKPAHSRSPIM
jgi:nucleotide-binding universal stress UspA family protein